MIVKQIYKIVEILGLLISLILSTSMNATDSINYGTLKVQAQTMLFGEDDIDLQTEWVKVEILKDFHSNTMYNEIFNNYLIEEGWIQVELGTKEDNKLNIGMFNAKQNWIKITIKDNSTPLKVALSTKEDLEIAIDSAEKGLKKWQQLTNHDRSKRIYSLARLIQKNSRKLRLTILKY